MSVRIINKYRVFCETEHANVYGWGDTTPVVCPNNNTHTINTASIAIVDSINSSAVTISQDKGQTGGNFRCETVKIVIKPNTIENFDFSWPFDMSVSALHFTTNSQHIGDSITTYIAPNTIVGYITQDANVGDTVIHVSPTVLQYINIGYLMSLFNGVQVSNLGYVLGKDEVNGTITTESPNTIQFAAASPTYVTQVISNIHEFEIGDPNKYDIGQSLLEGGLIPANTTVRLSYNNKSLTDVKSFIFYFEYFY